VLFMIRRLGVLSESFRQLLGNHSGRVDVFCLGEESGCPDSVAFFKQFIWEVGFQVGSRVGFIFLISIFYKGWEGAGLAGVYSFSIFPLCILFCLAVGLTADTAARKAPGHFDRSGTEVDLWIVLVQPGEPEYHALLAEAVSTRKCFLLGFSGCNVSWAIPVVRWGTIAIVLSCTIIP